MLRSSLLEVAVALLLIQSIPVVQASRGPPLAGGGVRNLASSFGVVWNQTRTNHGPSDGCDRLAKTCLAGKTVIFVGSSVSRHWAFILIAYLLLCPTCVQPRSIQKELCGNANCEAFCGCFATVGATTVRFEWYPSVYEPKKLGAIATYIESGLQTPNSTVIVVLEPGFHLLVGPGAHRMPWAALFKTGLPALNATLASWQARYCGGGSSRGGSRCRAGHNPARLHLYWRTLTPLSRQGDRPKVRRKPNWYSQQNRKVLAANSMIQAALSTIPSIDVYKEAMAGLAKYDDIVHHSSLIPGFLRQLLEIECKQTCNSTGDRFDPHFLSA